jgi:outer membrane protein
MNPRMHGTAVLLAGLVLAGAAWGAEPAANGPVRLTLQEAVRMALSEGAASRIAALKIQEARSLGRQAGSALLPQVGASASEATSMTNLSATGITLPPPFPRVEGPFGVFDVHITAAMNVIDVAAMRRYRAAQQGVRVSEAEQQRVRQEVAAAVAQLYVAVQRAQARVGESQANVELFGRLRDLARDQWQAGVATRLDSLRAEVQVARERQNLLVATSQRDVARLALLRATGADLAMDFTLADTLNAPARDLPELEQALAASRQNRPDLLSAEEALKAARMEAGAVSAERLPTLGVSAQAGFNGQDPFFLDGVRTLAAGINLPLFTGGRMGARLDAARVRERQAEVQRDEVRRQVEEDVRRALLNHRNAASRVALAEDNLRVALQEVEVAMDRFANGASSNIEVDNAQSSLAAARDARVTALADEAQAWYELARATGTIKSLIPAGVR